MKPKLLVLASGQGTTFAALVAAEQKLLLDMQVVALITDRDCGALALARQSHISAHLVSYTEDKESFADRLQKHVDSIRPDFIMLAGFLRKVPDAVVRHYHNRIFNTHPSLLPDFGGAGMYGLNVHRAVIAAHRAVTGITFHCVSESYDEGAIIAQKQVAVQPGDTAEILEERIKSIEKYFVIEQLNVRASHFRRESGISPQ